MKKIISFLIVILAVIFAAPAEAQQWPDGYQGDQIESEACFGVILEATEWLDRNPWGQVSPVGTLYYGTICPHDGTVVPVEAVEFRLEYIVAQRCTETPYSGGDGIACTYRATTRMKAPPRLLTFWFGTYISYVHEDDNLVPYEAIVWDADTETGTFTDGAFDFVSPLWFYESDRATRTRYSIHRWDGDPVLKTRRGAKARR